MNNTIKYGLKNAHYAVVTEGADGSITYGTPKPIPGAVTLSLKASVEKENIPADDIPDYATVYDNKGYDGELEVQILPDDFKTDVLGETLDTNGVLVENKDAEPKNIALLFEFSGDKKKARHVMYNCSVTKPDIESSTKGDKAESKTDKLTFSASPAKDTGNIKAKIYSDNSSYATWFNSVYLSAGTPAVLVSPTEVVFDKKTENQKDIVLNLIGGATLSSIKNGGTTLSTTTHYTNTSGVVTIKATYLATLGEGLVQLLLTFSGSKTRTVNINIIDTTN